MTAPMIQSAEYDYLPVTLGSELAVGDFVVWGLGYQMLVADVTSDGNAGGGTDYTFSDGVEFVAQVSWPPETSTGLAGYTVSLYKMTAHPPVGTKYTNTGDGSRWVFQASETYRCFVAGSTYPAGTVLTRALIVGGMAEET